MSKKEAGSIRLSDYLESTFHEPLNVSPRISGAFTMNFYHWHRHYEIFRIFEGSYTLINNRTFLRSDRPAIIIHKPYTLHNLNSEPGKPYVRRFMNIRRDVVHRFIEDAVDAESFFGASLIYVMPDETSLRELDRYFDMADCIKNDDTAAALIASLLIRRTMQLAKDGYGEIISCSFSYIQNVLTYIADNLSEPCTIAQIAEKFGVKRSKFQSDFKAVTGVPYHRYLITLRLTRSREMLLEGYSIQKTAMDAGYSSEAHFIKAFHQYWGHTPGQLIGQCADRAAPDILQSQ